METINKIFENCLQIQNTGESEKELSKLPPQAGLILFADSQNSPIMLLSAANIRRTVRNKFAEQTNPTKKADLKSITARIYYKICPCKFRLSLLHWQAVRKMFPDNYKDYITFVWPSFISVNLEEQIPSFSVTKKPAFGPGIKILGPLPGARQAATFLKALEDAFRLCKRNDLVRHGSTLLTTGAEDRQVNNLQAPESCQYIQMDACCGVCSGKTSRQEYKEIISEAFEAAANPKKAIETFQSQMQMASKELDFEKAAELKRRIEKISILSKQAYRWTGDLEKLKIVHIDKSAKVIRTKGIEDHRHKGTKAKVQTYAVFVINFGQVIDLGDFQETDVDTIMKAIEEAHANLQTSTDNIETLIEQFAIVTYFLYRSKASGLWIDISEGFNKEEMRKRTQ